MKSQATHRGFALVITLSLMILLTVLAVGLLTLASVELRTSNQGVAMATARANARMALALAIGELQKTMGPDKAVSATAEILSDNPAKPCLMGAWESWDYTSDLLSDRTPNYTSEKTSRFKGWLVSTAVRGDAENKNFVQSDWSGDAITLAGKASYGGTLPPHGAIKAGRVPIFSNGKQTGAYAWQVSDESVKARFNLFRDPSKNTTVAHKRALLAGHRPDVSMAADCLDFLDKDTTAAAYQQAVKTADKITDFNQAEFGGTGGLGKLRPFRDAITPYSRGVLADVRSGGLKRDLSSIFEFSPSYNSIRLPAEYNDKGLYQSTHEITAESDPRWSRLASYYNIFKSLLNPDTKPAFNQPPTEEILMPSIGSLPSPPSSFFPGPVIAKVQVLFTLVTRPNHGGGPDGDLTRPLLLHLMYTPIVTLHNPYNVSITFDMLEVEFQSVPIGMRFTAGTQDSGRMLPFNELYDRGRTGGFIAKAIVLKISNWKDYDQTRPGGATEAQLQQRADAESLEPHDPIVMLPGQTLICCPYLDPTDHLRNDSCTFFDYGNTLTRSIKTKPGFFGNTIGFTLDWLGPDGGNKKMSIPRNNISDTPVGVTAGAVKPTYGGDAAFEVTSSITVNGTKRKHAGIRMAYPRLSDLQKVVKDMTFTCMAADAFVRNFVVAPDFDAQINEHAKAQPFALFSASARTANGGVNESGARALASAPGNRLVNGLFAGKPMMFHNPALPVALSNLAADKQGTVSYELSFEPVTKNTVAKLLQSDAANRARCISGNMTSNGLKSCTYLEVPSGPLQTIADFRRSNVLASGFAPALLQPIGSSTVPPTMHTTTVAEAAPGGYKLLDHSVLANHALYDGFYFSTFAQNGRLTPKDSFEGFMKGTSPLLSQAFYPHLPQGATVEDASSKLFSSGLPNTTTYQNASAYQMIDGAFNVNSTNVNAWKAKLASMRDGSVPSISMTNGTIVADKKTVDTPVFSMTLPSGGAVDLCQDLATDTGRENRWNGYRQLNDEQLERLAACIVKQVRRRGPFLSMSEFVNRRIGPDAEETRRGALESAIVESGINDMIYTDQVPITSADIAGPDYGFETPAVVVGNPAEGAPGWISQGDVMKILEPAATVRSDTFVIRVCGEAACGGKAIRVYAEALVQRMPEYVDPAMDPSVNATSDAGRNTVNKKFGRRLEVRSFRWLNNNEI